MMKIKRYKDGTFTPLMKPHVRRVEFGDKKKKRGKVNRYLDKAVSRMMSPY